jgi:flavin-dependent dehydrogenase
MGVPMSKKILIAGAGHGGLVAAAYLAEQGYDVSVYEKVKRCELGYPWDDMINRDTFLVAGVTNFDINDVILHPSITLVPPSQKSPIELTFTPDVANFEIERKVLYKYLLQNADDKGVKMFFESEAALLLNEGGEVAGLTVNGEDVFGDLVIDSSGGNSQIVNALPSGYGISYNFDEKSRFFTYRGRFEADLTKPLNFKDSFAMYLLFNGLRGISWFKIVDGLADVLIGSIDPLNEQKVAEIIEQMKLAQPAFTGKLVTGGLFNVIPFGPPLKQLVGNNFAVIGDAACMALPINGSGISFAVYAGKILADTVIKADKNAQKEGYTASELKPYQKQFAIEHGAKMHEVATLKNFLLALKPSQIDFVFDKKIINEKDMGAAMFGEDMKMSAGEMLKRALRGISNLPLLIKLGKTLQKAKKATKTAKKEAEKW